LLTTRLAFVVANSEVVGSDPALNQYKIKSSLYTILFYVLNAFSFLTASHVSKKQGDQIGRIFALWVTLDRVLKIKEVGAFWATFSTVKGIH
jgi:hypothetical protein